MPANERHRSHQQPGRGIDPQQPGHGDTDQVLKGHEGDGEAQEDEQGRTTAHQVAEACIHSHRGEEVHQQEIAGIQIETEVGSTDDMQKCEQQSDQETARNGFRDRVIPQKTQLAIQAFSQEENQKPRRG